MKAIVLLLIVTFFQSSAQNRIFEIARTGSVEELLIEVKKDSFCVQLVNEKGYTPLLLAVYRGNYKVAEKLIELGADVNFVSESGTILMAAIFKVDEEMFRLILHSNADINLQDKQGNTPLMFAVTVGNEDFVNELLKRNANKNIQNKEGQTAFMLAVQTSNEKIINLLK
ncbi:ankyrin repeat domain-containing protein [Flavobacterium sp. 20NA77.7]|uniref:Ankyrin repeat domain-containing protein n=1 Tax=Flavobacterium nakdongensis TaxID=3073563 RepID=A0ABY9RBC8_9FLAO|nr:ankyrin repeat domain-containing protein [Flavobacterium sp. 20NA77.7]WMW78543.1 ankyrin repeat domain-containing protein [Flavobacterium sp. 20NA77.7]